MACREGSMGLPTFQIILTVMFSFLSINRDLKGDTTKDKRLPREERVR